MHASRTASGAPARTWRVQAAATAALFVLAGMMSLAHQATTHHVRCAEHGELIDAAEEAAGVSILAGDQAVAHELPAAKAHGHDHCLLACAARESTVVPLAPALAPTPHADAIVAVAPPIAAVPGGVLYRTAPKTSPPA